ncbi:MAG: D-glycero-beta-D-manno-heptose 1-phosphate adenylyltransferase [Mariprofundaceae bacterium]|nr:D-glycero-beta-D-manno-heptose 1-phosphate adenylyltransferase [Mariprofundaceae bacterium]
MSKTDCAPCLSLHEARHTVAAWRRDHQRTVFTNGCFDLLHPGHIDYLQHARALGDALIIGLNNDASVRGLKGPLRPINPLHDRAIMLGALGCVDLIVPFNEPTPIRVISALLPDILVKGGDYNADDIVGAEEVRANGGEVIVMPFISGYSSSALIQRIVDVH